MKKNTFLSDFFWEQTLECRKLIGNRIPINVKGCFLEKDNYKPVYQESIKQENIEQLNKIANKLLDCVEGLILEYNGKVTFNRSDNCVEYLRKTFNISERSASFLKSCLISKAYMSEDTKKRAYTFDEKVRKRKKILIQKELNFENDNSKENTTGPTVASLSEFLLKAYSSGKLSETDACNLLKESLKI